MLELDTILPFAGVLLGAIIGAAGAIYTTRSIIRKDTGQQRLDRKLRLSMAALDKRLAVHQEAFVRWNEIVMVIRGGNIHNKIREAEQWWIENCLYLDSNVNEAFTQFLEEAQYHYYATQVYRSDVDKGADTAESERVLKENENKIAKVGHVIFAACELPSFSLPRESNIPSGRD